MARYRKVDIGRNVACVGHLMVKDSGVGGVKSYAVTAVE